MTRKIPLVQTQDQQVNQLQQNIRNAVEPYMVTDNYVTGTTVAGTSISAGASTSYIVLSSMSLSPGTWDITATAAAGTGGGTFNGAVSIVIDTVPNSAANGVLGINEMFTALTASTVTVVTLAIPLYRVFIKGPNAVAYYLNGRMDYTGGSPAWSVGFSARQVAGAPSGS